MNTLLLSPAKRFALGFLLLSIASTICSFVFKWSSPFGLIGTVTIVCALFYFRYFRAGNWLSLTGTFRFLDRYALWLLVFWVAGYLTWCGLVLFTEPYQYEVNHGDAVFYSQTLWNLVHGLNPENSFFTFNGLPLAAGEDPRYANTYGYVSIFTLHQYWLPMAVLAPLYAIFSQPPMHLFALQICVIVFGVSGMYWAVRQYGGSRPFAILAAIGYSLLPQVDVQLFFKGYFDVLALGVMPWLFGALIGRKWLHMYFFALLVALISYPHTFFIIIFGISTLLFFHAFIPGVVVMLIGWIVMKVDTAVFMVAVSPYYSSAADVPSFFRSYVLERKLGELVYNVKVNSFYVVVLLQGLAFLPLLALRRNGRWDMEMVGFWFMLGGAFVIMLFRSAGWEFPRNSFLIVPLFMMAVMACINLNKEFQNESECEDVIFRDAPFALLCISMTAMIFLGVLYNTAPLASHLPWGKSGHVRYGDGSRDWDTALAKLHGLVPNYASIAWRAAPEVQAFLTNRQNSWHIGREPEGVKYYVFLGEAMNATEKQEWESLLARFRQRQSLKLLYEGVPGKPLVVFENLHAHPIPRNENLLGWNVLRAVFSGPQGIVNFSGRK